MDDVELEQDIERRRREVGRDIGALGDKLTPENVKAEARHRMRGAREHTKQRLLQTPKQIGPALRNNPIPVAMIAGGVGWLLFDAFRRGEVTPYEAREPEHPIQEGLGEEPFGEEVGGEEGRKARRGIGERVGERVGQTKERAQQVRGRIKGRFEGARTRVREWDARESLQQRREKGRSFYEGSPLAVAGVAMALGFGLGAALPPSEREQRIAGDAGRRLKERATEMAQQAKRRGEEAGRAALEGAMSKEEELETEELRTEGHRTEEHREEVPKAEEQATEEPREETPFGPTL